MEAALSASEHLAVLRGAGLIASRRAGQSVVHSLTELGLTVLRVAERDNGKQRAVSNR